jgi:cutinase
VTTLEPARPTQRSTSGFQISGGSGWTQRCGVEMNVIKLIAAWWPCRVVAGLSKRQIAVLLGVWVVAVSGVLSPVDLPSASADPCPDVEVVFARGTSEAPGVGGVGQAFVDALQSQVGGRSVGVYPVNYAASSDFGGGLEYARTVVDGIRDAGAHVESTAAKCPNTRIVLGGYSQGAVVVGFVTSAAVPAEVPASYLSYIPKPMAPEVANHVAAVVLFGKPSDQFMRENGVPPVAIGPLYASKTIELCAPGDDICNGVPGGRPGVAHIMYPMNGMVDQGASFAASRL